MKVTKKILDNYKKLKKSNSLSFGISFNDNWNIANFGITREQYNLLVKTERYCGGFENWKLDQINQFLNENK